MTHPESLLSALSAAVSDLDVLHVGYAYQVVYEVCGVQRGAIAFSRTEALKLAARDIICWLEFGTAEERAAADRLRAALSTALTPDGCNGAGAEDLEET